MDEKKLQKEIETNVWKYCPYRFDDPETKMKDSCGLHDCHCVAIDSPYSHAKNKKSICKVYNDVVPKRKRISTTDTERKRCLSCNKFFIPTSGHNKYCDICAKMRKRDASRKSMQRKRVDVNILGS